METGSVNISTSPRRITNVISLMFIKPHIDKNVLFLSKTFTKINNLKVFCIYVQ